MMLQYHSIVDEYCEAMVRLRGFESLTILSLSANIANGLISALSLQQNGFANAIAN